MPSTKANEARNILLHYSLPCFSGIVPEENLQHWALLVEAVSLLSKREIRIDSDLSDARVHLQKFCRDFVELYG